MDRFKKPRVVVATYPREELTDTDLVRRQKEVADQLTANGIDPTPLMNITPGPVQLISAKQLANLHAQQNAYREDGNMAINNAMAQQNAAAQLWGNSQIAQAAAQNTPQPYPYASYPNMISSSGEATKAHERFRVVIETVSNGFTVQCGRETYVAANLEDLANVIKVALVTAKLVDHITT